MPWSLVEILTGARDLRRAFYAPLAAIPPGRDVVRAVPQNVFTPSDTTVAGERVFNIRIAPPFNPEDTLPDAAMRLHAMAPGTIRFQPNDAAMRNRLILEMPMFLVAVNATWWQRWVEAQCLPHQIIYENVDRTELEARLESMTPGVSLHGLRLPADITLVSERATFIAGFLAGTDGFVLSAEAGAVIGTAATDPAGGTDRLLKLRARYNGHTDAAPRFMNPREFLHLLFGNDSVEFASHPLLLKINAHGLLQPGLESKTMRMRPPLRTFGRLEWEANLEINNHPTNWRPEGPAPAGILGPGRLYNNHTRGDHTFNNGGYEGENKCNLFTSEIGLRSGFRAAIHDASETAWHYLDANSHANLLQNAVGVTDRVAIMGRVEDRATIWSWKIENWIRAQPLDQLQARLNNLINSEGRCLVLAGARPRRFLKQNCGGVKGICNCGTALRKRGIGHIVLVREVLDQPTPAPTVGEGFQRISVRTLEATGSAAESLDRIFQTGGEAPNAAAATGFIRLHLFELHPGEDPDTERGLRNLNIRNSNVNLLRTANEAAANKSLNLNANGTLRTDNRCCHDEWPTTNAATDVAC